MPKLRSIMKELFAEKDTKSRIINCNPLLAEYAGLKSVHNMIGKTDYDLCWSQSAHLFMKHEQDALSGKEYSTLIPLKNSSGENKLFLHTKIGKKDANNKIVGITCHSVEVFCPKWNEYMILLEKNSPIQVKQYYFHNENSSQLTGREKEILFYIARGKSNKIIANALRLSVRTIEHYLENLKNKLHYKTRAELISFAIQNGFLAFLPKDSIENLINSLKTSS